VGPHPHDLYLATVWSLGGESNSYLLSEHNMDFTKLDGLVPAVIQDADSGEVLMVGFMNDTALAKTRDTGFATFYSRSRQKLWTKGETSGNKLAVQEILIDCDDDTVLVKVKRLGDGNVCHTGERTCFFRPLESLELKA
jgi:phosphoribosyl-AMP cyclohydrolase